MRLAQESSWLIIIQNYLNRLCFEIILLVDAFVLIKLQRQAFDPKEKHD